jgi:hypothetical protein
MASPLVEKLLDTILLNARTMHEVINEPVKVLAHFVGNSIKPLAFEWRGKRYPVKDIDLVHVARDGDGSVYYFDITDDPNHFSLSFHTRTMAWQLNELYYAG